MLLLYLNLALRLSLYILYLLPTSPNYQLYFVLWYFDLLIWKLLLIAVLKNLV